MRFVKLSLLILVIGGLLLATVIILELVQIEITIFNLPLKSLSTVIILSSLSTSFITNRDVDIYFEDIEDNTSKSTISIFFQMFKISIILIVIVGVVFLINFLLISNDILIQLFGINLSSLILGVVLFSISFAILRTLSLFLLIREYDEYSYEEDQPVSAEITETETISVPESVQSVPLAQLETDEDAKRERVLQHDQMTTTNITKSSPSKFDIEEIPDLFISYSSKENEIAVELNEKLKDLGISSWVASKSVKLGEDYSLQILDAIDNSAYFMIIVTEASIGSRHVKAELERAFSKNSVILPIMLDEITIPRSWEYYLSTSQWKNYNRQTETNWIESLVTYIVEKIKSDREDVFS